jgi:predicted transposase YbfD/YdcC
VYRPKIFREFARFPEERMVAITRVGSIKRHFRSLPDPRVVGRTQHLLIDIVVIAICAVIADCDDWSDIVQFAQKREGWFRRFLKLPAGIPAHDTFERLFAALDSRAFERCCLAWFREAADLLGIGHIAIDGKTMRGSSSAKLRALHVVSAWATQANLTLGQVAVDKKSNEITAIPKLLDLLDLHGALVTIDAIGCQKEIAKKIVEGGGDYLLAVKGNQEHLLEDIQTTMEKALNGELDKSVVAEYTTREDGHGRHEERSYVVVHNVETIRDIEAWPKASTVGMCRCERTVAGKISSEIHYFIGSRRMGARKHAQALRNHWKIENNLHWQLDVSFGEDNSRIQNRQGAENFGLLRKIALTLLKRNQAKKSIARKRKAAALDTDFLEEILAGVHNIGEV